MPETDSELKAKVCSKCGTELMDNDNYCPMCGRKIYKEFNNKILIAIIVCVTVILVSLLVIVFFSLSSKDNADDNSSSENSYERKIDQKNADELCMQIQTCITDYEIEYSHLGGCSIIWDDAMPYVTPRNIDFKYILSHNIDDEIVVSKETGNGASAVIEYSGDSYKVTVTLGNCKSTY